MNLSHTGFHAKNTDLRDCFVNFCVPSYVTRAMHVHWTLEKLCQFSTSSKQVLYYLQVYLHCRV